MDSKYYCIYDADNGEYYGETYNCSALYFDTEEETIQILKQITAENMSEMEPGEIRTFEIHNSKSGLVKKFYISCEIKMEIYDLETHKYEDINFTENDEYLNY